MKNTGHGPEGKTPSDAAAGIFLYYRKMLCYKYLSDYRSNPKYSTALL